MIDFDAQMARHKVRKTRRLMRLGNRAQRFFGDVFLDLRVTLKLVADRAQQRFNRGQIAVFFVQILGRGLKKHIVFNEIGDGDAGLALDQHFHRAIGQFEQLQHIRQHAGAIDTIGVWIIIGWINLA